jgi:hypothetical protein
MESLSLDEERKMIRVKYPSIGYVRTAKQRASVWEANGFLGIEPFKGLYEETGDNELGISYFFDAKLAVQFPAVLVCTGNVSDLCRCSRCGGSLLAVSENRPGVA